MSYLDLARQAINEVNPSLTEEFLTIAEFSQAEPELAVTRRKKGGIIPSTSDLEHYRFLANKFSNGHKPIELPQPKTIPDPALSLVIHYGYSITEKNISNLIDGHRIAMVAENMVGDLLERYLNSVLKDTWVWCAGAVVKHVDFIHRPQEPDAPWEALQIKNRDNSENSSSSKIRSGTSIKKWYRTKSRNGATMWDSFPLKSEQQVLSEEGFHEFVKELLINSKTSPSSTIFERSSYPDSGPKTPI